MKIIIFILILLVGFISQESYAEKCWLTDGCEGQEVYVYVPPTQYDKSYKNYSCYSWLKVFEQKNNLPKAGTIVEPHHNDIGWYDSLDNAKYKYQEVQKLFRYETDKKQQDCLRFSELLSGDSPSWGGDIKAQILSYSKLEKGFFVKIKILVAEDKYAT